MYAERLKMIRKELRYSIEEFAKVLNIPARTIGGYERKERNCSIELVAQLCKCCDVNANWFVSGEGEMFNTKEPSVSNNELEQKVVEVMKKLINAQNLIEDLKNSDIDSYKEIKENTLNVAKKWGGKRANAGRKPKNKNNVLSFQMKVSEKERKFLLHARECNLNYDDLLEG